MRKRSGFALFKFITALDHLRQKPEIKRLVSKDFETSLSVSKRIYPKRSEVLLNKRRSNYRIAARAEILVTDDRV